MPALDGRTWALALTASGILGAGIAGLWSLGLAPVSLEQPLLTAEDRSGVPSAPSQVPNAPVPAPRAPVTPNPGWSPDDSTAVVARRYREATDKRAFFTHALQVGGGAHLYFARAAATDCLLVSTRGAVGAEQFLAARMRVTDAAYQDRLDAYRRQAAGCQGFEAAPARETELRDLNARLDSSDDPIALPSKLVFLSSQLAIPPPDREAAVALARRLVSEPDPWVLQQLPYSMATLRVGLPRYAETSDSAAHRASWDREYAAWALAACALGYECVDGRGRSDFLCVWAAECGSIDFEEYSMRTIAANHHASVRGRRDEIVRAVRERDWAALGL